MVEITCNRIHRQLNRQATPWMNMISRIKLMTKLKTKGKRKSQYVVLTRSKPSKALENRNKRKLQAGSSLIPN